MLQDSFKNIWTKTHDITPISLDEFIQRVAVQPNGNIWSVLVVSNLNEGKFIKELRESLELFAECSIGTISGTDGVTALVNKIQEACESYLIIWEFEDWENQDWRQLDQMRSKLVKKRGVTLVISEKLVQIMFTSAPNIVSWVGSRVYAFIEGAELLSDEERQARLLALNEWSGLSNAEVIEMAQLHKLPSDPEYGEWLVLLGRGDLIER